MYKDIKNDWHHADDLNDLKKKLKEFYSLNKIFKKDGTNYTEEEIQNIIDNIQETELEEITVKFKKPNFKLNSLIYQEAVGNNIVGSFININPLIYNKTRIKHLLVDWNLKNGENPLPITEDNIGKLPAALVDGIVGSLNNNICHYFGNSLS